VAYRIKYQKQAIEDAYGVVFIYYFAIGLGTASFDGVP